MAERWNPWRTLRERRHLELRWAWLPDTTRGRIEDAHPPPRRIVTLGAGLDRRQRRATLAHELVHDERGLLPRGCPPAIRSIDERAVRREVARRLVPPEELAELVRARGTLEEPVTVTDVAEAFDVPLAVALEACRLVA